MAVNYNARIVTDRLLVCWDVNSSASASNINKNIVTFPEDFANAYWTKLNCSIIANQEVSPDGTRTASTIVESIDGGTNFHNLASTLINLTPGVYTHSCYVKIAGTDTAFNGVEIVIATGGGANYNLNTVTRNFLFGTATAGTIQALSDGWFRITTTVPITATGSYQVIVQTSTAAGNTNYQGTGRARLFIWGSQLETGSTPTTYFPVNSSPRSTTWSDISGRNNNCVLASGITLRDNNNIRSLYFSGTQRSRIPTDTFNTFYSGKTMFVVAKIDSNFGSSGTFRGFLGGGGGTRNFNFYLNRNGSLYRFHFSQGVNFSFPGGFSSDLTGLALNQWFVGAVTQTSAGLVTYYFNGVPVGTHTTALQQFVPHTDIDYLGGNDAQWFGDMAFCAAYSRALSSDEILQMYNALRGRYGL